MTTFNIITWIINNFEALKKFLETKIGMFFLGVIFATCPLIYVVMYQDDQIMNFKQKEQTYNERIDDCYNKGYNQATADLKGLLNMQNEVIQQATDVIKNAVNNSNKNG